MENWNWRKDLKIGTCLVSWRMMPETEKRNWRKWSRFALCGADTKHSERGSTSHSVKRQRELPPAAAAPAPAPAAAAVHRPVELLHQFFFQLAAFCSFCVWAGNDCKLQGQRTGKGWTGQRTSGIQFFDGRARDMAAIIAKQTRPCKQLPVPTTSHEVACY